MRKATIAEGHGPQTGKLQRTVVPSTVEGTENVSTRGNILPFSWTGKCVPSNAAGGMKTCPSADTVTRRAVQFTRPRVRLMVVQQAETQALHSVWDSVAEFPRTLNDPRLRLEPCGCVLSLHHPRWLNAVDITAKRHGMLYADAFPLTRCSSAVYVLAVRAYIQFPRGSPI